MDRNYNYLQFLLCRKKRKKKSTSYKGIKAVKELPSANAMFVIKSVLNKHCVCYCCSRVLQHIHILLNAYWHS